MMIETVKGFADDLMLINAAPRSAALAFGEQAYPVQIVQRGFAAALYANRLWPAHSS